MQASTGKRSMSGWVLGGVLALLIAGIAVLVAAGKRPEQIVAAAADTAVPVSTHTVRPADIRETITYSARIEPESDVLLAVEQSGPIAWIGADKGDTVEAGQPLLQIDSRNHTSALERAEVQFRQAQNDLQRWDELRKSGSVSQSDYEGIATRRDLARIAVSEARVELAKCTLRAPAAGVVQDRLLDSGEYAAPGLPAFRIAALKRVKVVAEIPERDVFAIQPGQSVPIAVDALDGTVFTGRITHVATAADPRSNTFRTEVLVDNPGLVLRPGIIARVTVLRRTLRGALAVPLQALIPVKGQYVAFVATGGHAVRRVVKIGAIVDTTAVVSEGLSEGDRVITDGQRLLADGVPVAEASSR